MRTTNTNSSDLCHFVRKHQCDGAADEVIKLGVSTTPFKREQWLRHATILRTFLPRKRGSARVDPECPIIQLVLGCCSVDVANHR